MRIAVSVPHFFETMYYRPAFVHRMVSWLLFPLAFLYGTVMWFRRTIASPTNYPVPIISVGNLVVGGSGKTPGVIALGREFDAYRIAVISRGYGRQSSGLVEVSRWGSVQCSVEESGDEPMLIALSLPKASVIVSEKRGIAIRKAIANGAEVIILDDGFNRVEIEKFEILLEPQNIPNVLPLPSGPFREWPSTRTHADLILKESENFHRRVSYDGLSERMVLVTAIANPKRLDPYLPEGVVGRAYLENHAYFDEKHLGEIVSDHNADSLLVTEKDWVKMRAFKLPISRIKLELQIDQTAIEQIAHYIKEYHAR